MVAVVKPDNGPGQAMLTRGLAEVLAARVMFDAGDTAASSALPRKPAFVF